MTPDATQPDANFIPAMILRNKGVPIRLKRVDTAGTVIEDDEGTALTVEVHLRFDGNAVAEIEDHFDGLIATVETTSPVVLTDPKTGAALRDSGGNPIINEQVVDTRQEVFYGLEAFQKAMEVKQNKTTRDAIAIALHEDPRVLGERLLEGEMATYATQVGIAWSMANGLDPTQASGALKRGLDAVEKQRAGVGAALEAEIAAAEAAIPGTPGSEPGAAPIEALRSSGD